MGRLLVLVKKEFLEQLRTKKLLIVGIVFLFVAVASPILAKLTPELLKSLDMQGLTIKLPDPTYTDALDQFIKNISQIALLVLVFVVAGAISDEKNRKTLEVVLTKSVSRTEFVLAKYLAYFSSISAVFILSSAIFYLYTLTILGSFSLAGFSIMSLLVLLYILMIVAITLLASTVLRNAISAGGVGFIAFILFGTVFSLVEAIKDYSPNLIFASYKEVVLHGWQSEFIWPTLIQLGIITLAVAAASFIFKNQEIER